MRRTLLCLVPSGPIKFRPIAGHLGVLQAPDSVKLTNLRDVPGARKVRHACPRPARQRARRALTHPVFRR